MGLLKTSFSSLFAALTVAVFSGQLLAAPIITLPAGLNAGDQYRLVFVTDATTQAGSDVNFSLNDGDTFVEIAASFVQQLQKLGTTWQVIGSTDSIDARTHTNTDPTPPGNNGVRIFGLDGIQIADNYDDLWDGTIDSPITISPTGATVIDYVFTGTQNDGTGAGNNASLNSPNPLVGIAGDVSSRIFDPFNVGSDFNSARLYGISGILEVPVTTVAAPVPIGILTVGLSALMILRRFGSRKPV